jgi:hypothetical protein
MERPCNGNMDCRFHVSGEEDRGFSDTICIGGAFSHESIETEVESEEREQSKQQQLRVLEVVIAILLRCGSNLAAVKTPRVGCKTG